MFFSVTSFLGSTGGKMGKFGIKHGTSRVKNLEKFC